MTITDTAACAADREHAGRARADSAGRSYTRSRTIGVALTTGDGTVGCGEARPCARAYRPAHAGGRVPADAEAPGEPIRTS